MAKKEAPLEYLSQFIPDPSAPLILEYLHHYKVHLTITRERKSVLGDYRHATHSNNHRISVNGNLNKYAFLITLLHELAHLLTFEKFGNRIPPHGKECLKKKHTFHSYRTIFRQVHTMLFWLTCRCIMCI